MWNFEHVQGEGDRYVDVIQQRAEEVTEKQEEIEYVDVWDI